MGIQETGEYRNSEETEVSLKFLLKPPRSGRNGILFNNHMGATACQVLGDHVNNTVKSLPPDGTDQGLGDETLLS